MKQEYIYKVTFNTPTADGRKEFYYHSLSAIYCEFTREQIGVRVQRLWELKVSDGYVYSNSRCTICRVPVRRKERKAVSCPVTDDNMSGQ